MTPRIRQLPAQEHEPDRLIEADQGAHTLTSCETVAQETVHTPTPASPQPPSPPAPRKSRREWLLCALLLCTTAYAAWQHMDRKQQALIDERPAPPPRAQATPLSEPAPPIAAEPITTPPPHKAPAQTDDVVAAPQQTEPLPPIAAEPAPPPSPPSPPANVPIRILSNAEDAAIHSEGRLLGTVGQTLLLEPLEQVSLTLSTPRHRPRTIVIDTGDGTVIHADYFVALEPMPAFIQVEARAPFNFRSPRRAEVLLNGTSQGEVQLPHRIELSEAATTRVGLRADGFLDPDTRTIETEPGGTTHVVFDLEHLETVLRLHVSPPEAQVWMGTQEVDPTHIPLTPGLLHAIRITADGYRPLMRDMILEPGETRDVAVEMRPYTFFNIVTDPPDASLFMDGRRLTERLVRVRPDHVYAIDARAPGYRPARVQHEAAEGTTEEVHIRMRRRRLPF